MIAEFISTVSAWITGMLTWLGDIFTGVTTFFYADEKFTFVGMLLLFGLAVGLIYFGINFVMRLIRK